MNAVTKTPPVPNLESLPHLEAQAAYAEMAILKLVKFYQRAVDEAQEKGGRSADLIALYRRVYDAQEQLAEAMKTVNATKDLFKFKLLPEAYEREQISTLTTAEKDRVTITQTVRASILAENRAKAYAWLRDHGHGDLIIETVNASTLSSFVKAELEQANELPEEIKVDVVGTASLTRGKRTK